MFNLFAKIRKEPGKKMKILNKEGKLLAVLYGPKIKNLSLELDYRDFDMIYKKAGESSLISLKIEGKKDDYKVLIHDIQRNPLTSKFIHIDLYQPSLKEKIEAKVSLVFEGEAEAVKKLGGTLIKNITEVEVKALPQDLPHEIRVNIDKLKTFEDYIRISDLKISKEVEILKRAEEIIASVVPPTKIEEELEKPVAAPAGVLSDSETKQESRQGREEKAEEIEKAGEKAEEKKKEGEKSKEG